MDNNIPWQTPPEEQLLAIINGLQQNLLTVVVKLDLLEARINELETIKEAAAKGAA
jgi:hypothetical protein